MTDGTHDLELGEGVQKGEHAGQPASDRPLRGARVVVTRPTAAEDPLTSRLRALGADVIEYPVIRIVPFSVPHLEREALAVLDDLDWVVFASANAVEHFRDRLVDHGRHLAVRTRLAAVGPGTARAVGRRFRDPDLVPERHVSEAVLEALLAVERAESRRFLIPGAREGRDVVADGLEAAGHVVVKLPVYMTEGTPPSRLDPACLAGARAVLFASPSAVRHFLETEPVPEGARIVTIGPVTSRAVVDRGLVVDGEASPHTVEGMVECLLKVI